MMASNESTKPKHQTKASSKSESGTWVGLGIAVCGALVQFFPQYADITSDWHYLYLTLGYILYTLGFLTAVGNLSGSMSEVLQQVGFSFVFLLAAFFLHQGATWAGRNSFWGTVIEHLVLVALCIGTLAIIMAIPLFFKEPVTSGTAFTGQDGPSEADQGETKYALPFERIVAVIIALLTLATAVIQFLETGNGD